jgi:hypothetical protein
MNFRKSSSYTFLPFIFVTLRFWSGCCSETKIFFFILFEAQSLIELIPDLKIFLFHFIWGLKPFWVDSISATYSLYTWFKQIVITTEKRNGCIVMQCTTWEVNVNKILSQMKHFKKVLFLTCWTAVREERSRAIFYASSIFCTCVSHVHSYEF